MIKVSSESSVRPVATIDSVVFDLNGTLVDSRGALARTRSEAVRQLAAALDIDEAELLPAVRSIMGASSFDPDLVSRLAEAHQLRGSSLEAAMSVESLSANTGRKNSNRRPVWLTLSTACRVAGSQSPSGRMRGRLSRSISCLTLALRIGSTHCSAHHNASSTQRRSTHWPTNSTHSGKRHALRRHA